MKIVTAVQGLIGSMETLAAIGAVLRSEVDGIAPHPEVGAALTRVVEAGGVDLGSIAELPREQKVALLGAIRALFRQAGDLVEHPERAPGWVSDDPVVLQGQGRMSIPIAATIAEISGGLGDLRARLSAEGAELLDVGTGAGWLAIALAKTFPALHVVGIDVFPPALALARENVTHADLTTRIELRQESVEALSDRARFDAAFIASPFLPKALIPSALARVREALRPGGWVLFGVFATVDDAAALAAQALRVARAGGYPWSAAEATAALEASGLVEVRALERTWSAPVGFIVGRRA